MRSNELDMAARQQIRGYFPVYRLYRLDDGGEPARPVGI